MFGRGGAPPADPASSGPSGTPPKLSRFGLLLAANLFLLALLLPQVDFFRTLELKTEDYRLLSRGTQPVHPDVAVIEIDGHTLQMYESVWPIPRDQYALLVASLSQWGATGVGFDLWFAGPDSHDPENDVTLAAITGAVPGVVHAVYLPLVEPDVEYPVAEATGAVPVAQLERLFPPAPDERLLLKSVEPRMEIAPEILAETSDLGHIALSTDVDGMLRRIPVLVEHRDRAIPSLALAMASHHRGFDWRRFRFEKEALSKRRTLVIETDEAPLRVPVDEHGRVLVNFPGDREAFPNRHSFIDVVNTARFWLEDRAPPDSLNLPAPEAFEGKIVLVCNSTSASADFGPTPVDPIYPLAYAHASFLSSLLRDDHIQPAPRWAEVALLAVLAVVLALLLPRYAPGRLAIVVAGTMVGVTLLSWALFYFGGVQLELIPPLFLSASLAVGILLRGYVLREGERQATERELAVARKIQQDLMPKEPLEAGTLRVAGTNIPCFAVGGDYFDYFPQEDRRISVAIGDVSGKGMPAALLMSNLKAILRSECSRETSVTNVNESANRLLSEMIEGSSKFITFFFAQLDPESRTLRYSNAGHNPPLLVRADGTLEELETGGMLLGIFPMATYEEGSVELRPGDLVVLFTDGVTEAEDRKKEQYGDERLQQLVVENRHLGAQALLEKIREDVEAFGQGTHAVDDLTVVVIKVEEEATERAAEATEATEAAVAGDLPAAPAPAAG